MWLIALCAIIAINVAVTKEVFPILIWHSASESCCSDETIQYIRLIQSQLGTDVYIKSVRIGETSNEDRVKSLSMHPFKQIDQVCREIRNDERLANGFNAIGLSQGGLFMRALVQICPHPKIRNLITLASPHQGVHSYPQCSKYFGALCMFFTNSINSFAYSSFAQTQITPLTFWHDSNNEKAYLAGSTFLAHINNEKVINRDYIENLSGVNKFVLVKFDDDKSIIPNESTHFGYVMKGKPLHMEETSLFIDDKLGLRELMEKGKMVFLRSPGTHLELHPNWFVDNIIPFLED